MVVCAVPKVSFAQTKTQIQTQTQATAQSRIVNRSAVPDENTLARLVWSTMIAVDNANRTGNYDVIYGLMSPRFQRTNTAQTLAQSFAPLRRNRVDIGRAILMTPNYYTPPQIIADGQLRLRGGFDYRPKSVRFDLIFETVNGGWGLSAISIAEMDFAAPK